MNYEKKNQLFFLILIFQTSFIALTHENIDHHVVCSLQKKAKTTHECSYYNHLIHEATNEIRKECILRYANLASEKSHHYPHRKDTVFFIQFHHALNNWTLYKPSFISFKDFCNLIKKIYLKYGLRVICHHDQIVKIAKIKHNVEKNYVTVDEFEKYKKMSPEQFETEITQLKKDCYEQDGLSKEIKKIIWMQKMQKFLFWHLQIPTTGLMAGEHFDINDRYKPIAWHFLLWDLAPKKGSGAHVAIIDTGTSAFNIDEKKFSSMYKKNINISFPDNVDNYGYNLVSKDGLDPIHQIAINFSHYCDHSKLDTDEFMKNLPIMIIDFIEKRKNTLIEDFFIKNAKKRYLNDSESNLNEKGEEVLKDLLYGDHGVIPFEKNFFFNIVHLQEPYNEKVLLETLPAPKIVENSDPFSAGHGTFTQGIVNARIFNNQGITGLAPEAQVTMIKAFNDNGTTNKTTLNAALQRAISLKNPIVSMSLKITDEIDKIADAPLKKLVDSIDYVIAASGNDGKSKKIGNKEAYPAKFESVAFDVGAFKYDEGQYNVCSFTQKEWDIGPKFVAPGFDIFSSGLTPHQTNDSMYLFMTGTSIAVPVITGFLALVLAEFQDIFSREQILKVIYKFSIKLNNDTTWQKYIKLGTPDMRSGLLCLHVLKALKNHLKDHPKLEYDFETNFENLVQAIYTINYYVPSCYEDIAGSSFTNNFVGFINSLEKKSVPNFSEDFFNASNKDLKSCIEFISKLIVNVIGFDKKNKSIDKIKGSPKKLLKYLQDTVYNKKFKLFAKLSPSSQNRINGALTPRVSHIISKV
jgi:subtilisin family serine protease